MIQEYDDLVQRTEELDARHFRELAMAFATGGACLMLVFMAMRGGTSWGQGYRTAEGSASSRTFSRADSFRPRVQETAETANGEYFLVASEQEIELPWAPRSHEESESS